MFLQSALSCLIALAVGAPASCAVAAEMLAGPYVGAVERVVDGDTIAVRVSVWLEQDLRVLVRVRGIDAPEVHGRCTSERERANSAAAELGRLVAGGAVVLTRIEGDKYYGRVLADVTTPTGEDVGRTLVAGGYARPYDGHARKPWCEAEAAEPDPRPDVAQAGN